MARNSVKPFGKAQNNSLHRVSQCQAK